MSEDRYSVILCYSSSYTIRAEKILINAGISSKLIPIPRHLSSNCGVCVRIDQKDREAAEGVLEKSDFPSEGVYDLE